MLHYSSFHATQSRVAKPSHDGDVRPPDLSPSDCLALSLGDALDLCGRDATRRALHGRATSDWSQLHALTMVNLKRLGFHCDDAYRTILHHEAKAQPGRCYGEALASLFDSQPWSRGGMIPASVIAAAFGVAAGIAPVVRISDHAVIA